MIKRLDATKEAIELIQILKEKHGDEFSWDELKMFKASIN